MPDLIFIPIIGFFCCVLAQFYLRRQLRDAMVGSHPEAWLALSSKSLFMDNALFSFVWNKRYKALGDAKLTIIGDRMHMLLGATIGTWLVFGVMVMLGFGFK